MQAIQVVSNAVTARMLHAPRDVRLDISARLSYQVQGAEHTDAFKHRRWDGRSTFYAMRDDRFPAGFVNLVFARLKQLGYPVQLVRKALPAPLGPVNPKVDNFPHDPRYSFQMETVQALLRHGQMIAQIATGGGKSRVARLAYARIARPTLFVTTRSVLMYQMRDSFQEHMGQRVGVLGDSEWSPKDGFNVGMAQTLSARLEDKTYESEIERYLRNKGEARRRAIAELRETLLQQSYDPKYIEAAVIKLKRELEQREKNDAELAEWIREKVDLHQARRSDTIRLLQRFEFVILEEAHEASANGYYDILQRCPNAAYRLSLTATPFMREDEEANMRLMACSGPIGIRVSEERLIELGILATPYFKYVENLPCAPKLYRSTAWQRAYKYGIVENETRNAVIVEEALKAAKYRLPVLVLVQHKAHGVELNRMLREKGLSATFIFGKHKQSERKAALEALRKGQLQVLVGSTILDTGVDVPALGMIIIAGGGKAEVAARQRIGRGLREKKSGPNVAFIVDFNDGHNYHLTDHAYQRRAIVESTPGFRERILRPGEEFDYSIFR